MKTTDGITGISETYGGDGPLAALEAAKSRILGMDPFRLMGFGANLLPMPKTARQAIAARPISCRAKIRSTSTRARSPQSRPLASTLSAKLSESPSAMSSAAGFVISCRSRPICSISMRGGGGIGDDAREDEWGECLDPESMVRQARKMVGEYGFREIKLKGGVLDPDQEIATIKALRREFGPEYPLRIDPNCAWSVDTSVHVGRELKEELSNGGYLEDPDGRPRRNGGSPPPVRAEGIDMPNASNVAVTHFGHVVEAARLDAVQVVLSDPHYWGGVRALLRLSDLCETLGLGVSMHSNNHLGVSLMTMAHAAAAAPHVLYACDTHYPWQTEQDEVIVGGRVKFENGCVRITDRPGLGVDLDYDQLARLEGRYKNCPTASVTMKPKCASMSTRTGSACCLVGNPRARAEL